MKYCPECGCKLEKVTKFCHECGSPLGAASSDSKGTTIKTGDANIRTFQDAKIKTGGDSGKSSGGSGGLKIEVGDANVRTFQGAQITGTQIGTNIEQINVQGASIEEIRSVIAEEMKKLNIPKTVAKDTKMDLSTEEEKKVQVISEKVEEAEERFGKLVGDAQTYVELGNVALLNGNVKKALQMYDKAISIEPENADAWSNKGYLLTNLDRAEEGVKCCQKATELDPEKGMPWNNLGFAQHRLGNIQDARQSFEKAVEADPSLALAWYNLGILVGNQGGIDEAIFYFDKALEADPTFTMAQESKATCRQYKGYTDAFEGFNDLDNWGFNGIEYDDVDDDNIDEYKGVIPSVQASQAGYPTYHAPSPYQANAYGSYTCPRCRSYLTYYPSVRRYYCHTCRTYL
jgi:tetratricopeptide (TPR) repeat protein